MASSTTVPRFALTSAFVRRRDPQFAEELSAVTLDTPARLEAGLDVDAHIVVGEASLLDTAEPARPVATPQEAAAALLDSVG